jgi:hypothetical protein
MKKIFSSIEIKINIKYNLPGKKKKLINLDSIQNRNQIKILKNISMLIVQSITIIITQHAQVLILNPISKNTLKIQHLIKKIPFIVTVIHKKIKKN